MIKQKFSLLILTGISGTRGSLPLFNAERGYSGLTIIDQGIYVGETQGNIHITHPRIL